MKKYDTVKTNPKQIKNIDKDYKNKSEKEIYMEITRINKEIEKEMSYEEHEVLFKKLKTIKTLLDK